MAIFILALAAPLLMGGCPQVRNTAIDAFETGVRNVLNTVLDLYFEQWRSNDVN